MDSVTNYVSFAAAAVFRYYAVTNYHLHFRGLPL